jgi:DnaJ family protein C protein 11
MFGGCPLTRTGCSCHSTDGVVVKAKFESLRQTFSLPIFLSDELLTEAVVYGTLIPVWTCLLLWCLYYPLVSTCLLSAPSQHPFLQLVSYFALQQLVIQPWSIAQETRAKAELRRRNRALVARRKQEAKAAVTLMQETVERKVERVWTCLGNTST